MMAVDIRKQKYATKFKDLRFKTEAEFDKWLKKTAAYHLTLEDQGQDLIGLWLDAGGEVIYTDIPQMGKVFNGELVDLDTIKLGEPVEFMDVKAMANRPIRYPTTKIEAFSS